MNTRSTAFSKLEWNGESHCQSWLNIKTAQGQGWLYCHPKLLEKSDQKTRLWLQENTLRSILSEDTYEQFTHWKAQQNQTATQIILSYRLSQKIKQEIQQKLRLLRTEDCTISLDWAAVLLPHFFIQKESNHSSATLYHDFRYWLQQAQKTSETSDDSFFELYCQVFPQDSIEYTYTSWVFPTDEGRQYSLLGKNIHFSLLSKADSLVQIDSFLEADLTVLSNAILQNICAETTQFWESNTAILEELETICTKEWSLISTPNKVLLFKRLEQFRKGDTEHIVTNARLGVQN